MKELLENVMLSADTINAIIKDGDRDNDYEVEIKYLTEKVKEVIKKVKDIRFHLEGEYRFKVFIPDEKKTVMQVIPKEEIYHWDYEANKLKTSFLISLSRERDCWNNWDELKIYVGSEGDQGIAHIIYDGEEGDFDFFTKF